MHAYPTHVVCTHKVYIREWVKSLPTRKKSSHVSTYSDITPIISSYMRKLDELKKEFDLFTLFGCILTYVHIYVSKYSWLELMGARN